MDNKNREKDYELNDNDLRSLQKNDILTNNQETYDIDEYLSIDETKPPPVAEEKIDNTEPERSEEIFDDITKAYFLTDEEEESLKDNVSSHKEKISYDKSKESETYLSDNVAKEREYLTKDDVLKDEPKNDIFKGLDIIKKPKNIAKIEKPKKQKQTKVNEEKNISTSTMIIVSSICIILVLCIAYLLKPSIFTPKLSEKEQIEIQETINFFINNENIITQYNEISDRKKIYIESYVADAYSPDELLKKIEEIKKEEEDLREEYNKFEITLTSNETIKINCLDFINSNISLSEDIIKSIKNHKNKQTIVGLYNNYTEKHNSLISIYNDMVKLEASKLNLPVTINTNVITIDTSSIELSK